MSTTATSMPSTDVPLISPATLTERFSSRCSSLNNCSASMGRSSSTFKLRMRSAI